jgi:hypothetical protein
MIRRPPAASDSQIRKFPGHVRSARASYPHPCRFAPSAPKSAKFAVSPDCSGYTSRTVRSDAASVDIAGAEPPLRTLGRYSLFGAIGSGGMATVHLARLSGAAGFSRVVAIKRMHPHLARDPAFVTMFTDEARVAARIRHPNVVQTLDVASVDV